MSGVVTGINRRYIAPLGVLAAAAGIALWISSTRTAQGEREFVREARSHRQHSGNDQPLRDAIDKRQEARDNLTNDNNTQKKGGFVKL